MSAGASHRRRYFRIFLLLAVLTALEVGIVYVPGLARAALISGLVALALGKAGLVLMQFMHLSHETPTLKAVVLLPFVLPAGYAGALIAEAAWRLLG